MLAPQGRIVEQLSGDPLERTLARERCGGGRADAVPGPRRRRGRRRATTTASRRSCSISTISRAQGSPARGPRPVHRWFRESGKKVFAYAESYAQRQYFLAAQADEVYLDPMGYVLLDGYGYYRTYRQGRDRQARGRRQRLQGRQPQVRAGRVDPRRHVGGGARERRGLDRRALDDLQGGRRRRAQARAEPHPGLRRRGGRGRQGDGRRPRADRARARARGRPQAPPGIRGHRREIAGEDDRDRLLGVDWRGTCRTCAPRRR